MSFFCAKINKKADFLKNILAAILLTIDLKLYATLKLKKKCDTNFDT